MRRRTAAIPRAPAVVVVAALVDRLFGEPPAAAHPVVWIGRVISVASSRMSRSRRRGLIAGGLLATAMPLGAWSAGLAAERISARLLAGAGLLGIALKPAFAVRALLEAGRSLERCLLADDLEGARAAARALVSRDVAELDGALLAAAAIESLSENLTDSVVAPLFYFALAGLPGAYAYRAVNTLDSMIGYHGDYEWLGKAAARLDDVANYVPARLAAGLLTVVGCLTGKPAWSGPRVAFRDHGKTASPNAGWTMALAAGTLGVRLEKRGYYVLNETGRPPVATDIRAARQLVGTACGAAFAVTVAALALRDRRRSH